ncbi:hypothetical protein ACU4GD_33160 [Cupriavidus basilensis]
MLLAPCLAAAADAPGAAQIERGRYLAKVANCAACHTSPGGAPFAGGLPLKTGVGTVYSTNITPDAGSGVGAYTFEEFRTRAAARGRGETRQAALSRHALPVVCPPRRTGRAGALCLLAHRSAKAVRQENRRTRDAPCRSAMRWLLRVWNWLFLETGPARNDASQSAAWNRGAYLVQAVAHCGACHTPRGALMAEKGWMNAAGISWPAPAWKAGLPPTCGATRVRGWAAGRAKTLPNTCTPGAMRMRLRSGRCPR